MTARVRKGLVVALLHVAIVASLGGKMLVDRATRPRVWARVVPFDPNMPIRGRYVRMAIEAPADPSIQSSYYGYFTPAVRADRLVFLPAGSGALYGSSEPRDGTFVVRLREALAYFIPEHVPDPSIRPPGEELWVEVTLPRRGPPRPIRLGVMKNGSLTPLLLD